MGAEFWGVFWTYTLFPIPFVDRRFLESRFWRFCFLTAPVQLSALLICVEQSAPFTPRHLASISFDRRQKVD